jgi:hypothetical protein
MTNISNDYKIDITMTAVIRPKLLGDTLKKIVENVVDDIGRFRLIINVDPIGEKIKPAKVIKTARNYFPNLIYNIPKYPSFPKAVKWTWSQSTAPFVLHWEDDIDILRKIDVKNMMEILNRYDKLSSLRLYKHATPRRDVINTFACKWRYNKDGFYQALDWKKQFGLNPILIKQEFVSEAVPKLRDDINPEKQFRFSQKYMRPLISKWKYGLYTKPGEAALINGKKGQRWKNKMKLQKPKGKTFLNWERG